MDQSIKEELWNTWSHLAGVVFGVVGLVYLLNVNTSESDFSTLSIWIYGLSFILMFSVSALYHAIKEAHLKATFRKLDHICIYILIAGSYTPVCLISLVDGNGWLIFTAVWVISALGLILKLFFTGRFEIISLLLYLTMGWMILFDGKNLLATLSIDQLYLMMLGGFFYTFGVVFYAIRGMLYQHVIWHFFVLAGAISHYFMILSIVKN